MHPILKPSVAAQTLLSLKPLTEIELNLSDLRLYLRFRKPMCGHHQERSGRPLMEPLYPSVLAWCRCTEGQLPIT
jgi:hypothetical protein